MAKSETFSGQLSDLATRVGVECLALHTKIGALTSLSTSNKSSIIAAINEVDAAADTLNNTLNGALTRLSTVEGKAATNTSDLTTAKTNITNAQSDITALQNALKALQDVVATKTSISDSTTVSTTTWSSTKINQAINDKAVALKSEILGGVDAAYDTLKEITDKLLGNSDLLASLQSIAAGHVKFDGAQTLTSTQQSQARTNIGAASQTAHEQAVQRITAVETKATNNATAITTLNTNLGDIVNCDFVADFETALAGSN